MSAIQAKDLYFAYDSLPVLEGISFSIEKGEYVAIFGPNGGGKTTLLHLLMGFLKPLRGEITIAKAPSTIGWVPQNFNYDRDFPISVEEVVLGGRLSHLTWSGRFTSKDFIITKEVLDKVGMKTFLKVPFATLSGGQAQRVLIARALAGHPSILLLDEPTASIDYAAQSEMYKMLKAMKGELTIVMVTHDLNNAVEHVDRLFCVQKELIPMTPEKVCKHFAIGLYHSPQTGEGA